VTASGSASRPGDRPALPPRTAAGRLVVVLRAPHASAYAPIVSALADGGVTSVEVTLTTPDTLALLPDLCRRLGDRLDIGVGTVTDAAAADAAIRAGADYLVTPVVDPGIAACAADHGVPVIMGAFTPTESFAAWRAGAAAVKVFPAARLGPAYAADLRGPFPDIALVPSGGIDLPAVAEWLDAGAVAVSVGSPLLRDAVRGGDLGALRERAAAFVARAEDRR
jgi:2-dehydro-3-deoxyphosphogluconate aldolase / (4S)-4-hydroxy-2-oxoglutarate aldolase